MVSGPVEHLFIGLSSYDFDLRPRDESLFIPIAPKALSYLTWILVLANKVEPQTVYQLEFD